MSRPRRAWTLWLVCACALAACRLEVGVSDDRDRDRDASFRALGALPGYATSEAAAVSADGSVVVGTSTSAAGFRQAFRWTAQGMAGLGFLPGGTFSAGKGVSASGAVVIGDADGGTAPGTHAFRWTAASGIAALPGLRGSTLCASGGVSADGIQIVGTCVSPVGEAVRWTDMPAPIGLGRFGTGSNAVSSANAVSSNGQVAGGAGHPVLTGAVLWNAANQPTVIGNPDGHSGSAVTALSGDGSVAVVSATETSSRTQAFRWSSVTGFVRLAGDDVFIAAFAAGVSADARRIVGWAATTDAEHAVLWDDRGRVHVVSDLLSPDARDAARGWHLSRARAISNDGRTIVGQGTNPAGMPEAWLVTLRD